MSDKFYVSRGVWYPIGEQAVGPTGPDGAHVHADPKDARIAELEAVLLTVREAFDADAGMAILIDRVLSSAALSTKEDGT